MFVRIGERAAGGGSLGGWLAVVDDGSARRGCTVCNIIAQPPSSSLSLIPPPSLSLEAKS